jgi:hypothetical protein
MLKKRAIVTPDKHFPYAEIPAIKAVCKAIELVEPNIYIDLGDTGEWEAFSKHKWRGKQKPPLEYLTNDFDRDVKNVNAGMDIFDEALDKVNCKEKYFCEGNHELWLNFTVAEHPYLPQYLVPNALKLKERGYVYYPNGKYLDIDKLSFYHGNHYGGKYHTAAHLRELGCNIMYGHWHDIQQMSANHKGGPIGAWSLGCLKDMSHKANKWLGRREKNWGHAFAIVDFYDEGNFTVDVVQIIDGKATVWGQLIDGNK